MSARAALAGALVLLASACASPGTPVERLTEHELGWRLHDVAGDAPLTLAAVQRRVLVLNLWATWCAPCVAELASFERLRMRLADADVAFAFITYEPVERVHRFAMHHGIALPFYVEIDPAPESLGVRALPTTIVIGPDDHVVLRHRGAAAWDTPAVERLLRDLARP